MSITLVIIYVIVSGVLMGQELIRAAQVRATVSQIEKYNTAVRTFQGKYGSLPGDIKDPDASSFGFQARGKYAGEGDGNDIIEGGQFSGAGASTGPPPAAFGMNGTIPCPSKKGGKKAARFNRQTLQALSIENLIKSSYILRAAMLQIRRLILM